MAAYAQTSAPHIHSSASVAALVWKKVLALTPIFFAALFAFKLIAAKIFLINIIAAAVASSLSGFLFHSKPTMKEFGNGFLTALLITLLMPIACPVHFAFAGVFFAVFLGEQIFGGVGAYPFQSALLGLVFLQINFPTVFPEPVNWQSFTVADFLFKNHDIPRLAEVSPLAVIVGGLFLIGQKLILWEMPFLYFFSALVCSWLLRLGPDWALSGTVFLLAFFVITDSTATPVTQSGKRIFAFASAGLAAFLSRFSSGEYLNSSILLMNILTPWMDVVFKPGKKLEKVPA